MVQDNLDAMILGSVCVSRLFRKKWTSWRSEAFCAKRGEIHDAGNASLARKGKNLVHLSKKRSSCVFNIVPASLEHLGREAANNRGRKICCTLQVEGRSTQQQSVLNTFHQSIYLQCSLLLHLFRFVFSPSVYLLLLFSISVIYCLSICTTSFLRWCVRSV